MLTTFNPFRIYDEFTYKKAHVYLKFDKNLRIIGVAMEIDGMWRNRNPELIRERNIRMWNYVSRKKIRNKVASGEEERYEKENVVKDW